MSFKLMGQKISQKLVLVYVYDFTFVNPDYNFTAKEMSNRFGCSIQSAINVFSKLRSFRNISAIGEEKRDDYQLFKITETGKDYAKRIKAKLDTTDIQSTIEANKAGVMV